MYSVGLSRTRRFRVLRHHEELFLRKIVFFSKMRQHCRNGRKVGKEIRDKIMDTPFQEDFEEELKDSWCNLWIQSGRCKKI